MSYRVVYGETIPAWEKTFPTMAEAQAFAAEHESFGDIIFGITRVRPHDKPKSLAAAIEAGEVEQFAKRAARSR